MRLPGQGVGGREELNAKFSLWLQSVYHARVHSSTGMTPTERCQRGAHLVKALDPHLDQTATLRSVMLLADPNGAGKSALVGRWLRPQPLPWVVGGATGRCLGELVTGVVMASIPPWDMACEMC